MEFVSFCVAPTWLQASGFRERILENASMLRIGYADDLLIPVVHALHRECVQPSRPSTPYIESLLATFAHRMLGTASRRPATSYLYRDMIEQATDFINENLGDQLSLARVMEAIEFPGDVFAFIRSFKRVCQLTPCQYIINRRLDVARLQLEFSSASVTEISSSLGFSSSSNFAFAFRRRWGVSPSEIRKRARKNETGTPIRVA